MAKKKRAKKHQFKYAAPTVAKSTTDTVVEQLETTSKATPAVPMATVAHADLLHRDLRKVIVLASGFVVLEFVLWFLLNHTSLGSTVYGLIKV
jgi:hypothetical protein